MRKQNKLIYFNNVVYALSKDYGFKTAIYRSTEVMDYTTGQRVTTRIKYPIKKAIFFPTELFRDFTYAKLFGQDMQFGGILDVTQRHILINKKWLPKGFIIEPTYYLIFNHERYEIQKARELDLADYWYLAARSVKGIPRQETFDLRIKDKLETIELLEQVT